MSTDSTDQRTGGDEDPRLLKDALRAAGLRATSARAAVLRCLLVADAPMTHAEVCAKLASHGYDRATLYRNLMDLVDADLATRTDLGDHLWRFERANTGHSAALHAHFVCSECGDVSCLPEDAVALASKAPMPKAVRERNVEIQVRGVCNDCG